MTQYELPTVAVEKLAGTDLRAFAVSDEGVRPELVELGNPVPLAGAKDLPTARTRLAFGHLPPLRAKTPSSEPISDDWVARMDDLERDLIALKPLEGPVRINLARGFTLTVTPSMLRAISRIPQVGIIRPRQAVQSA